MCCFFASLLFFGPRFAFLIYWIFVPTKVSLAFGGFNLPWLVGILGLAFVPFFSLMYVVVFPLNGYDWFWLGLALAVDIMGYVGGDRNRHKVPGYSTVMPGDVPPSSTPAPAAMAAPMAAPAQPAPQAIPPSMPTQPPASSSPEEPEEK